MKKIRAWPGLELTPSVTPCYILPVSLYSGYSAYPATGSIN